MNVCPIVRERDWSKAVRSVQCRTLSWYDMIWWLYMTPVYIRVGGRLSLRSKGDLLAPSLIMLSTLTHTHTLSHTHTHTRTHAHLLTRYPPFFFFFVIFLFLSRFFLSSVILSIFCLHIYRPFLCQFFYLIALFMKLFIFSYWKTVAKTRLFSTLSQNWM